MDYTYVLPFLDAGLSPSGRLLSLVPRVARGSVSWVEKHSAVTRDRKALRYQWSAPPASLSRALR